MSKRGDGGRVTWHRDWDWRDRLSLTPVPPAPLPTLWQRTENSQPSQYFYTIPTHPFVFTIYCRVAYEAEPFLSYLQMKKAEFTTCTWHYI